MIRAIWFIVSIAVVALACSEGNSPDEGDRADGDFYSEADGSVCHEDADCPIGQFCDATGHCGESGDNDGDIDGDLIEDEPDSPSVIDDDGDIDRADGNEESEIDENEDDSTDDQIPELPCLEVNPVSYEYGNVDAGEQPACHVFEIRHLAEEGCKDTVRLNNLQIDGEGAGHFILGDGAFSPGSPAEITAGEMHALEVCYRPSEPSAEGGHRAVLVIHSDSSYPGEERIEISLSGESEKALISAYPCPVDFGETIVSGFACADDEDCPTGQICHEESCFSTLDFSVYSWGETPLGIITLDMIEEETGDCGDFLVFSDPRIVGIDCAEEEDCPADMLCEEVPYLSRSICHIRSGAIYPGFLKLGYHPDAVGDDSGCNMRLRTTLPGMEFFNCQLRGSGIAENIPPVAAVSLSDHGAPITEGITGVSTGERLCFYGNISSDADGHIATYVWETAILPPGSMSSLIYLEQDKSVACLDMDVCGVYEIGLTVTDDDGADSDPVIITITVDC